MWTLIIISHILMFISFLMLFFTSIKGHFTHNDSGIMVLENLSIMTIMTYVFTQSLIFFLIININKQINNLIIEHSISIDSPNYLNYKKKMHIHTSLHLVYIATLAILFGAVHTGLMNIHIHQILFIFGTCYYIYVIKIQYVCFKEMSQIISRINDKIMIKLGDS